MEEAKLKEIYTIMVRIRAFEERALSEYRKGLPGFIHSSIGQEAVPAAVCAFLRADDYVLSTHRGHGHLDLPPKKESSYNVSKIGQKGGNKWSGEVDYQEPLTENKVDYSHSLSAS